MTKLGLPKLFFPKVTKIGSIIIWPQIRIDYNGVGVLRGQPLIPPGEKSWKGRKRHSTFIPDPDQLSLEETG